MRSRDTISVILIALELFVLVMLLQGPFDNLKQYTEQRSYVMGSFPKDFRRVVVPMPTIEVEPAPVKKEDPVLPGFEVTWYNDHGTTASGEQTVAGRTVGVDPRVIPLGTWIEINMPDGSILKRRAEDTGGAVKGRILDVYANRSDSELFSRGRSRGVTVKILGGE